jgi:Na+/H+ antiporter NhaD/arsenite permease-like protein
MGLISVIPFLLLLGLIAAGPVLLPHFWHRYYKLISIGLGLLVLIPVLLSGQTVLAVETTADYLSFIVLLGSLFVISGGIHLFADRDATPALNTAFLLFGAVLANVVGTTGASVLLIRPFVLFNRYRIKPFHVVFFIFIVSNAGGMLTPLGDPPLFFGFLKGVPFGWNIQHLFLPWLVAVGGLLLIFYFLDRKVIAQLPDGHTGSGRISLKGKRNLIWLAVVLGALFLDPKLQSWVPAIHYHGHAFSWVREALQLSAALASYLLADKKALSANEFSMEPILEVVFLFFGIFYTMMPALALVQQAVQEPEIAALLNPGTAYWATGLLSSFLDNAPSYISVLAAVLAKEQLSINALADVRAFISEAGGIAMLRAISLGAVLFGAATYVGNGPNLMVKAIAEKEKIGMPSFGAYIGKYTLPYLIPVLILVWWLFA